VLKLETPAPRPPRPTAEKPIAKIENLELHFPLNAGFMGRPTNYLKAIDGVSLTINQGETVGVVGESGSGKTTLGRTLLRVYDPTGGQVMYWPSNGEPVDIATLNKAGMKSLYGEVRMVFQDPHSSLNPRMTIYQTISEPLRTNTDMTERQMMDRVSELLSRVGLPPDIGDRYPHAFSGGQRQRISIARAVAVRPRLIIGARPDARPADRIWPILPVHFARYFGHPLFLRSGGGDEEWSDCRGWRRGADLRKAAARIYAELDRRRAAPRSAPARRRTAIRKFPCPLYC